MSNKTKAEELKEINEQKKELAAKQKTLREELDKNKEVRKEARTKMAEVRKNLVAEKKAVRDLLVTAYPTLSKGSVEDVNKLADEITEASAKVATSLRTFATESEKVEGGVAEDGEEGEDL